METEFLHDKKMVRRAFSRAAQTYDDAAVLQNEVMRRMLSNLDYMKVNPQTVLDAGSGTGAASRTLRKLYPKAKVIELDFAHGMLAQSRQQTPWWKRFNRPAQICADIENLPLKSSSIDLLWSNLALQWCNDIDAAFLGIHRILRPEGLFMFSTFGPDTLKELKSAFAGSDNHIHVNRFLDMHDVGDALVQAGFSDPVMDMEYITLTYDDVKNVMLDLKAIGAHNANLGRPKGLFGKTVWSRVLQNYETLRRDGRLPATYEVVYGHAWKTESTKTADGHSVIKIFREK